MTKKLGKGGRFKTGSRIKIYRRFLQISVALVFILIPWLNSQHISFVYGNFLCFNLAGIPLADPLAVLQITLKNAYLSSDLLIGAVIAIVLAFFSGTVFCSWACPFGLLSDLIQGFKGNRRKKTVRIPENGYRGFKIKLALFIFGLGGFMIFSTTPVLNQFSMPAWYSRIFQFLFTQLHFSMAVFFILAVLMLEFVFSRKIWCRYICPQSVLIILGKQLNRSRRLKVKFDTSRCLHPKKGREPCVKACTMALDPKDLSGLNEIDCTNCGDCIVVCKNYGGALKFRF